MMQLPLLLFQAQLKPLEVSDRAPNVVFFRPSGQEFRLSSLRGKVVVVEFTILACPPCKALAPHLEKLATEEREVVFLTVCADSEKAAKELLKLRPRGARTVFLRDPLQEDRRKMAVWQFGDPAYPSMYVIGRDGKMASRLMLGGVDDLGRLRARIAWAKKLTKG